MDEQKYYLDQSLAELDKLVEIATKETDSPDFTLITEKLKALQENFPESENRAEACARVLVKLSKMQTTDKDQVFIIEKVRTLYKEFPDSQDIALSYAMALFNLSNNQNDINDRKETISKLKDLSLEFQNSQDIALWYANALANLSIKQTELEEVAETAQKIQVIYEKFEKPENIALLYATALLNLSNNQNDINDRKETISKLKDLSLEFQNSQDIALWYANALANLSIKQTELEEVAETAQKIQVIYEKFEKPENIALLYATALVNLSLKQTNLDKLNDTVSKLKRLHDRFVQSEKITVQYLTARMDLVKNNQIEQSDLLKDICQSLESISSIKILNMLVEILENEEQFEQNQVQFPTTSIIKALDQLCFNSSIKEEEDKEKNLLIRTLKLGIISDAKYDILKAWIDHYGEDSKKINQLIKIYKLVQKIKYQLGLKDEDKNQVLKFGHYTKGRTLQIMLDQEENDMLDQEENEKKKSTFSVSGKTRLYNANYMNDPEEGIVIEKILGLDRRDILEPSSWFLMSFTNKTDDLAMWSQYGDDAKGVCLVLREDDFSRFTSFNDVSWRKEGISLVETMNKIESTLSYDLKGSPNELNNIKPTVAIKNEEKRSKSEKTENVPKGNRDYLYRIAYIKNTGKDFELEKSELFDDDEIKKLDESVNHLKQKLGENLDESDSFYKNAISECIEEIRYLFKSVDYKYENELRILHYANLDPSNDKIKIDKESGIGKLYVERENPIQIEEVIFGPKFPNPEYVTPLLKLLDKEIKYKKSTIKFR